ncbi:UNVERIFIED_CONTAM: hypothetical protein HDU68_005306 [Siphonaria sp. JEL0065]|nr:hypothetical protein HDU68_005306 [Siphonaria sp. JEL0065]
MDVQRNKRRQSKFVSSKIEEQISDYDSFLSTRFPTELIQLVFAQLHPSQAFKFRRLCRRINECLCTTGFVNLNLDYFLYLVQEPMSEFSTEYQGLHRVYFKWPEIYQTAYSCRVLNQLVKLSWMDARLRRLGQLYRLTSTIGGPQSIPKSIGLLTNLKFLKLSYIGLEGFIPTEITLLTNLETLNLGFNNLHGTIPTQISALFKLKTLNLGFNAISGEIPVELCLLQHLRSLKLNNNSFTGILPLEINQLRELELLDVGNNSLTGQIPFILEELGELYYLDLSNNHFSGSIPPAVGSLLALRYLFLQNNQLTGEVPREFGNLFELDMVSVKGNALVLGDVFVNDRVWHALDREINGQ